MKAACGRIRLGGFPDAELFVQGVAQDDVEIVQGFVDGAQAAPDPYGRVIASRKCPSGSAK